MQPKKVEAFDHESPMANKSKSFRLCALFLSLSSILPFRPMYAPRAAAIARHGRCNCNVVSTLMILLDHCDNNITAHNFLAKRPAIGKR